MVEEKGVSTSEATAIETEIQIEATTVKSTVVGRKAVDGGTEKTVMKESAVIHMSHG